MVRIEPLTTTHGDVLIADCSCHVQPRLHAHRSRPRAHRRRWPPTPAGLLADELAGFALAMEPRVPDLLDLPVTEVTGHARLNLLSPGCCGAGGLRDT